MRKSLYTSNTCTTFTSRCSGNLDDDTVHNIPEDLIPEPTNEELPVYDGTYLPSYDESNRQHIRQHLIGTAEAADPNDTVRLLEERLGAMMRVIQPLREEILALHSSVLSGSPYCQRVSNLLRATTLMASTMNGHHRRAVLLARQIADAERQLTEDPANGRRVERELFFLRNQMFDIHVNVATSKDQQDMLRTYWREIIELGIEIRRPRGNGGLLGFFFGN